MSSMKVLLHTCCAPCANQCVETLRREGEDVTLFWHNPNIHPLQEFRARREALRIYARLVGVPLVEASDYGLRPFLAEVKADMERRCAQCYRMRLEETARYAHSGGFDGFSTSLLISPYQNHAQVVEIARTAATRYGTAFVYRDYRPQFRAGQQAARDLGLYMQKYCGCIFSEEERYTKN